MLRGLGVLCRFYAIFAKKTCAAHVSSCQVLISCTASQMCRIDQTAELDRAVFGRKLIAEEIVLMLMLEPR